MVTNQIKHLIFKNIDKFWLKFKKYHKKSIKNIKIIKNNNILLDLLTGDIVRFGLNDELLLIIRNSFFAIKNLF